MSSANFYKWRAKYGGIHASRMARLKELEDQRQRHEEDVRRGKIKSELRKETLEEKW